MMCCRDFTFHIFYLHYQCGQFSQSFLEYSQPFGALDKLVCYCAWNNLKTARFILFNPDIWKYYENLWSCYLDQRILTALHENLIAPVV
jgi:hypothetical protein